MVYKIQNEDYHPAFLIKTLAYWYGHTDVAISTTGDGQLVIEEAGRAVATGAEAEKLLLDAVARFQRDGDEKDRAQRTAEIQPGDMIWVPRENYGIPMIVTKVSPDSLVSAKPAFKTQAMPGEVTLGTTSKHFRINNRPGFKVDVYRHGTVTVPAPTEHDASIFFWSCKPEIPVQWSSEKNLIQQEW